MAFQPSVQALSTVAGAASGPPPSYSRDALIASLFGRGPIGSTSMEAAKKNFLSGAEDPAAAEAQWNAMLEKFGAKSDADLLGSATAHQQHLASDLQPDFGETFVPLAVAAGSLYVGAGSAGLFGPASGSGMMPPAIPEPDPTFGGVLQQTAPGVFEAGAASGAVAGAETLGATAGPPIPASADLLSPSPGFAAPPLASDGISYAGLPAGDPAAPGVYGGEPTGQYGGPTGMPLPSDNPLDWLKQLSKTASPYLNLASAGLGLYSAGRAGKTPSPAPVYDPFAGQRAQYQQQLSRLSADPNYLTELPGYKAGLEATRRGMAAGGYNLSGNEEAALFQYGGNIYNQEATRLANLAGANVGPMVSGASPSNVAQAELVSRSLASLGYAAKSLGAGV